MSILIKGMEMPKSCYDCVLNHSFFRDMNCANLEGMSGFVGALPHTDDRHPDCPLVFVPPHGTPIDADAMLRLETTGKWIPHEYGGFYCSSGDARKRLEEHMKKRECRA